MIYVKVQFSSLVTSRAEPVTQKFTDWAKAANWVRNDMGWGFRVVDVRFTGKHAREAQRVA